MRPVSLRRAGSGYGSSGYASQRLHRHRDRCGDPRAARQIGKKLENAQYFCHSPRRPGLRPRRWFRPESASV